MGEANFLCLFIAARLFGQGRQALWTGEASFDPEFSSCEWLNESFDARAFFFLPPASSPPPPPPPSTATLPSPSPSSQPLHHLPSAIAYKGSAERARAWTQLPVTERAIFVDLYIEADTIVGQCAGTILIPLSINVKASGIAVKQRKL